MKKIIIGESIRKRREALNYSQDELGEKVGVSGKTISSWEVSRTEPNMGFIQQLADVLKLSTDELIYGYQPLKIMTHKVPIYGAIPAGTPLEAIQDNIIDHIEVPSYLAQRKGLFALRIEGDSMNMIAGDGMVAVFESTDRLEDGELGAVYVNGYDATFKKFHRLNNMIILEPMSYNPAHEPIIIKDAEGVEVTAVGRLVTIAVPRDYVDRLK